MEFTTHLELHSQTTRLFESTLHRIGHLIARDSHPLWRPVPRNIDKSQPQGYNLQITTRTPKAPDFKFELLPLHSPLLRQSLLVSFPPLIDMLKFSGYSYLIWGQTCLVVVRPGQQYQKYPATPFNELDKPNTLRGRQHYLVLPMPILFKQTPSPTKSITQYQTRGFEREMTLKQACPLEYQRAQCAFKDSMIHENLQFILLIAFRCVLHRCENQEIRCWKFWRLIQNLTNCKNN